MASNDINWANIAESILSDSPETKIERHSSKEQKLPVIGDNVEHVQISEDDVENLLEDYTPKKPRKNMKELADMVIKNYADHAREAGSLKNKKRNRFRSSAEQVKVTPKDKRHVVSIIRARQEGKFDESTSRLKYMKKTKSGTHYFQLVNPFDPTDKVPEKGKLIEPYEKKEPRLRGKWIPKKTKSGRDYAEFVYNDEHEDIKDQTKKAKKAREKFSSDKKLDVMKKRVDPVYKYPSADKYPQTESISKINRARKAQLKKLGSVSNRIKLRRNEKLKDSNKRAFKTVRNAKYSTRGLQASDVHNIARDLRTQET